MKNPGKLANDYIQKLPAYVAGKPAEVLERELGIKRSIKLASNESPLGASPKVIEALREHEFDIALYPDSDGYNLKQALAKHLGFDASNITLGNGSEEIIRFAIQCFVPQGKAILIPEYSFLMYNLVAKSLNVAVQTCPLESWHVDPERFVKSITKDTKLIFIANPGNPTGTYLKTNQLQQLLTNIPQDIIIVLDEAYYEYMLDEDYPQTLGLLDIYPNLMITRTFSKAYGLAGLRVGYSISHPEIADMFNRVRGAFNVNTLAQFAAIQALEAQEHIRRSIEVNQAGQRQLNEFFQQHEIDVISEAGNFVTIDLKSDALPIYEALLKQGVIVRPLKAYGLGQCLRISIGLGHQNESFMKAFEEIGVKSHV